MRQLLAWCETQLNLQPGQASLSLAAGDASARRYYRLKCLHNLPHNFAHSDEPGSWIVMDAPPDKENSQPFIEVASRLQTAEIHAPQIYAKDLAQGWLLLEDLGDELFKGVIDEEGYELCFDQAFSVLCTMIESVSAEGLPRYDRALLQKELDLFPDWFLIRHKKQPLTPEEQVLWCELCKLLIGSAQEQPQVFVHRDFHSCNLLRTVNNSPGVIDFQDAVCGPITYDLISLLWDRYITWPRTQLENWMEDLRKQVAKETDPLVWRRWCDLMGMQRNLKVVGIFARLCYRDRKSEYLDLIPRFASYVLDISARYDELQPYRPVLEKTLCMQ